ncbi:aldo/keto reductase [Hyphobacterium sp.]|uniref:aldo/keto reductase n=1 Tax=Hyphobacterium sp. TaxID=2004662 RepID=UPI00374A5728
MDQRKIDGFSVNPIGLGCMGLSAFYGEPTDQADAIKLLHAAIEAGVNHFDTAEMYGMGANEKLLGAAFADRRDKVRIATKFGPKFLFDADGKMTGTTVDGTPANMRRAVENSLSYLKTDVIDLYYLHRVDPKVAIEETVGAMGELVAEGKVRAIGLSEASADTIRRAHATHPISAVQSEYSIFSRDIESEVLPVLKAINATLVAYSPLGRGLLTGAMTRENKPSGEGEYRQGAMQPRFADGAYEANLALVDEVKAIAETHGATPGQIALAWVLGRASNIVAIPGTTKLANLKSNLGAAHISLSQDQLTKLEGLADKVQGARYNETGMSAVNR